MSILCTASEVKYSHKFIFSALISAFLCAVPFTCPSLFFAAWLGIAPFFKVLLSHDFFSLNKKRAFCAGFGYGFFYCAFIYYWFIWLYPLDFAGLTPLMAVAVIAVAWIGISAFQAVGFGLGTLLFRVIGKQSPFLLATIFTLCEFSWHFGALAMPWCKIGITQYRFLPFIQSSALFGSLFVSFIIYFVSALFVCGKRDKRCYVLAAAVFFSNILYGTIIMNVPVNYTGKAEFSLIQGNIASGEKWSNSASESFKLFRSLSHETSEEHSPDIIVWPESAVPVYINGPFENGFKNIATDTGSIFITGAFGVQDGKTSNSVFMIDPDGNINDTFYSKRHLVPFGEYLPARGFFETFLPFVADINMLSDDLYVGKGSGIFSTPYGNTGALVCFDSIFPSLASKSVRDGAQLIVLVTNDSWYFTSPAVHQHAAQAVFRAVENRRSVARCANTGISMLIDPHGRIISSLGAMQKGIVNGSLGFTDTHTLYTCIGDILVWLGAAYVIKCIMQNAKCRIKEIIKNNNNRKEYKKWSSKE
ncbi:MAG: apolipoprotein N-acyltransferase [Clostridia bacterium]|nr:apolipoprotein N-acyltransferase [Clostridia bacterium]